MAANLQKHGYQLIVFNRTPEKSEVFDRSRRDLGPSTRSRRCQEQVDVLFTIAEPDPRQ